MRIFKSLVAFSMIGLFAVPGYAAKATPLLSNFNAGEVSPLIDARSDLEKYQSGNRTMENFLPLVEGGATRTPGTYFALETKDSSQASRLFPFHFSTTQAYVIEAGDLYFRFYKDDGQIGTVDSSTTLLAHFDGTDAEAGNYTSEDTNAHTITTVNETQLDTAQKVFGTASMLFDGTDDYVTISDSNGVDDWWHMGTGAYTIDFWVRMDTVNANNGFFQQRDDATNYVEFTYNSGFLGITYMDAAAPAITSAEYTMAADTWYHVALIRGWGGNSDNHAITINGIAFVTEVETADWPDLAAVLEIGRDNTADLDGWIDEFRVTKGVARWTANFIPPTQAYPYKDTGTLTGGGLTTYEVTTTYEAEDLFEIKTVQSADVLYLFHPDYPTKELTRTAHTSWTLTDHQAKTDDAMAVTGISKANPAVVTCTTVPTTLAAGDIVYITGVVGMTEVNNIFFTVGTVVTGAGGTFQLSGIDSSAYGAWASGGIPQEMIFGTTDNMASTGAFFEQRLVMSSTNNNPQTIYFSRNADYNDFDTTDGTVSDDDPLEITLASDRVDRIRWLVGQDSLLAGTVGGVWKIGASSSNEALTPTNISAKKQITAGVKDIEAALVSDSVLWVSRAGTAVKQLSYSFEVDKYVAPDLTRIAKHIAFGATAATSGIVETAFQSEPVPILWAVRADGQLLGMTYETQEHIYAWFRVVTDGDFESVAVISRENDEDQVWVIANRTIDGSTARYVEYFKPMNFYSEIEDAFFVHSGLTWTGTTASTVTAITKADPCVVTVSASHGIEDGDKLKFRYTGTWLDTHTVTAHSVDGNDITLWTESDSSAIDSTAFATYVYPNTSTTITYTGDSQNITDIEQSNPARITIVGHGLPASSYARIASVSGMTEIIGDHEILSVTEDTFTVDIDSSAFTEYTSGGTVIEGTATSQNGTAESVIKILTGLSHLEGETVTALVDGAAHPDMTVASGTATMSYYGNKVHVGMPFTSTLEPMKLSAGSELGTSRGKKQRIYKITTGFYETNSGKAGPDTSSLKPIPFGVGNQPTLWTEDIDFQFPGDWGNEATISIVQDTPLPMTVLAIVPYVIVSD